ncbi:MAG: tyrosine-type recombinase/integrase [Steroidobacteraceae bacterium]
MSKMKPVSVPRTLPAVLSREEVAALLAAARNLKHQTALSIAYGAGLRASEVISLKVGDIDSTRMTLRIEQGKGGKDRYAMLSPVMLERLRTWWRVARAQGTMLEGGWLFPGMNPVQPMTARQLNRAVHEAALNMGQWLNTPAGRAHYRRRKTISEPVFGWIKQVLGFRTFSLRGLSAASAEWHLICTAINFKRMHRLGWVPG